MHPTPIIDMFSGTGELARAVPEGAIVTIGAPCQDLSVAGKGSGAERGFRAALCGRHPAGRARWAASNAHRRRSCLGSHPLAVGRRQTPLP